ncbi:hypothetical protein [Cohnella herbarum]|uniref:Uncharacterized protein n=1 Tax=Cohnella herbarum TaxID=2728023 RepID=A0A7Z2VIV0_9BACL|nr:hypothetical protein [Cohnella herbarum]QJD83859.1 hypothetical protein HH215_12140 [Cohnella herbarum]
MAEFRLNVGKRSIVWGTRIDVDIDVNGVADGVVGGEAINSISRSHGSEGWDWDLPDGVYRAKGIVRELGTLLEAILIQLGDSADSEALLLNIEASLAISGREAVLPLRSLELGDKAGSELSGQAERVGASLAGWAREFLAQEHALKQYGKSTLGELRFRSRCDHHLWTPKVTELLTGAGGGPSVMQLFNEYLHQIVLLRDALIPFDNWEEVPIELKGRGDGKGFRFLEQARTEFLSELLVRKMSHKGLVRFAQTALSSGLSKVGYGFQYKHGTILPASLGGALECGPSYLLRWYPVWTTGNESSVEPTAVVIDYASPDYYSEPRSHAGSGLPFRLAIANLKLEDIDEARLIEIVGETDRIELQYRLRIESVDYGVDLGQALRGHRFMYRPHSDSKSEESTTVKENADMIGHRVQDILGLPGLVTSDSGIHYISAEGNSIVQWALLGKIYPENVILLNDGEPDELEAAKDSGKGFGTKFLIR